jgi:hypothetical protein
MQDEQLETLSAPSVELLGERRFSAYTLRKQGLTYREIGKRMGVCEGRANYLYKDAIQCLNRGPHWTDGFSVRLANLLNNCNINSREEALEAYQSGRLRVTKADQKDWSSKTRGYGWKSHKELAKWLGLPEPQKSANKRHNLCVCPHCGGKLS